MSIYNICLTFDINYSKYAEVLIDSISENLDSKHRCQVNILTGCSKLVNRGVGHFRKYDNIHISIIDVSSHLVNFRPSGRFPPQVFSRFFIHEYLNGVVLYLDVDILVNCCISRLFNESNFELGFAACIDRGAYLQNKFHRDRDSSVNYFNAGVFICDTENKKIREKFQEAIRLAETYDFPLADQDALNCAISGEFNLLSEEFNNTNIFFAGKSSIIHFAHLKPTKQLFMFRAFRSYINYVDKLVLDFPYQRYPMSVIIKKFVFVTLSKILVKGIK